MRSPDALVEGILAADRRALARAITLAESTRPEHRDQALAVIDDLLPRTGQAVRIGLSGAPGVGKSTLIEALGLSLVAEGRHVAVLAVDPSSTRTGGSILGDKTRMGALASHTHAFIRPSPSGGTLGGVARRTREAMLLCEAFGFDVVVVETVGIGQSEVAVDDLVDVFVVLVQPGAGDELQAIKRGVIELADVLVVTKADGDLAPFADRAAAEYSHALRLLRPKHEGWQPRVVKASATSGSGIADIWQAILDHRRVLDASAGLARRRSEQAKAWLWSEVTDRLVDDFRRDPRVRERLPNLEREVAAGTTSPSNAARALLNVHEPARD